MQMAISDFKAKCLALLDDLHQQGGQILLTKRGKVIARIHPINELGPERAELIGVQMRPDWR
jgi:antitoxin (DNA-binding transcriptional repressor) of toxin-antitoxin stability system